jgi:hypothetical protein
MGVGGCAVPVCARDRWLDLGGNRINGSFPSAVSGLSSLV